MKLNYFVEDMTFPNQIPNNVYSDDVCQVYCRAMSSENPNQPTSHVCPKCRLLMDSCSKSNSSQMNSSSNSVDLSTFQTCPLDSKTCLLRDSFMKDYENKIQPSNFDVCNIAGVGRQTETNVDNVSGTCSYFHVESLDWPTSGATQLLATIDNCQYSNSSSIPSVHHSNVLQCSVPNSFDPSRSGPSNSAPFDRVPNQNISNSVSLGASESCQYHNWLESRLIPVQSRTTKQAVAFHQACSKPVGRPTMQVARVFQCTAVTGLVKQPTSASHAEYSSKYFEEQNALLFRTNVHSVDNGSKLDDIDRTCTKIHPVDPNQIDKRLCTCENCQNKSHRNFETLGDNIQGTVKILSDHDNHNVRQLASVARNLNYDEEVVAGEHSCFLCPVGEVSVEANPIIRIASVQSTNDAAASIGRAVENLPNDGRISNLPSCLEIDCDDEEESKFPTTCFCAHHCFADVPIVRTNSEETFEFCGNTGKDDNGVQLQTPAMINVIKTDQACALSSPRPERKKLGRKDARVRYYPAEAFKFYMEQHVENVTKSLNQRQQRRRQLEEEMELLELKSNERVQMRNLLFQKETQHLRLKRTKMKKSMFETLAVLGSGAFGNVSLIRKKDSGMLYAMKTLLKQDVFTKKQIAHVKAERDILAEADNDWVVKLYFSFQDVGHLYLVMDYIPGGDLMGLLMKRGIFEHSLAQFYIAELVLAIESVHKLGFIHRDIKPDNILIDLSGHIKLTDFGLCTGFHWTHDSNYYHQGT